MLNRKQIHLLLLLRHQEGNPFFQMPLDLMREITGFGLSPNIDFLKALHHVAYGELKELQIMLEANSLLLLFRGTVVTPAGLTVVDVTLLECALGAGDTEMVAMILPYFSQIDGGEEKKEMQLERYRPCIEAMLEQPTYDFISLFKIIKESSLTDVLAAPYRHIPQNTKLSIALNQFRKDFTPGILKEPRMHCNYQNFIQVINMLNERWNDLKEEDNCAKNFFIWQLIFGFIEWTQFPAYERYAFARGCIEGVVDGQPLDRSFKIKDLRRQGTVFPIFEAPLYAYNPPIYKYKGLGLDFAIDIFGNYHDRNSLTSFELFRNTYKHQLHNYCVAKKEKLLSLLNSCMDKPDIHVRNSP